MRRSRANIPWMNPGEHRERRSAGGAGRGGSRRGGGFARGLLLGAFLLPAAAACGDDVISRETFIDAYVALRQAELAGDSRVIPATLSDSLLNARGLASDDLLRFADRHGEDPVFMSRVWSEVERRVNNPDFGRDTSEAR